jgi:hypothetical protein
MSKPEVRHRSCTANSDQDVVYVAIFTNPHGNAYRVRIRRNAYDFQSHVKTDVWTATGWAELLAEGINNYPALGRTHARSGSSALLPVFDSVAETAVSVAAGLAANMPLSFCAE